MAEITLFDFLGTILSLATVYLFTQASIYAWPASIVANIVNGILFYKTGIFGHMGLEFVYVVTNIYGWIYWSRHPKVKIISFTPKEEWIFHGGLLIAVAPILYFFLRDYMHSDIAMLDGLTTVLNLNAAWLMCRGRVESWIAWFVVDSIYISIYWVKFLPFHLIKMLIYLVLAIHGYRKWFQLIRDADEIESDDVVIEVS